MFVKSSRTFVANTRGPCTLQRIFAAAAAGAEYITHNAVRMCTLCRDEWNIAAAVDMDTVSACQPRHSITAISNMQSLDTLIHTHLDSFLRLLLNKLHKQHKDTLHINDAMQ